MGFRLKVIFRGLCGFVQSSDEPRTDGVGVFLIDARAPGKVDDQRIRPPRHKGKYHYSHVPAIRFRLADFFEHDKAPDYLIAHRPDRPPMGAWILRGDDLCIDKLPGGQIELDKSFADNVPSLDNYYDTNLSVKQDCFNKQEDLLSIGLIARLALTGGILRGDFGENDPDVGEEDFAIFETNIESSFVELRSSNGNILKVGNKNNADDYTVELVVENVPPPKLVDEDNYCYDFELVYRIAADFQDKKKLPELRVEPNNRDGKYRVKAGTCGGHTSPCGLCGYKSDAGVMQLLQ